MNSQSPHLSIAEVAIFVSGEREWTPEEFARFKHISTCSQCLEAVQNTSESRQLELDIALLLFEPHLSYEDECGYLEGTLSESEKHIADQHLNICAHCRDGIDALRRIDEEMYTLGQTCCPK